LFTLNAKFQFIIVLLIGTGIEIALALTIARAQKKLIFYLEKIRKIPKHAEQAANEEANKKETCFLIRKSRNRIVGYYIPLAICVILFIALLLSIFFPNIFYKTLASNKAEKELRIELNINNKPLKEFTINPDTIKVINIFINEQNFDSKKISPVNDTSRKNVN
jgi:hypothetical protein